jgi:hypothetical protein
MSLNERRLVTGSAAFAVETIGWWLLLGVSGGAMHVIAGVVMIILGFVVWAIVPDAKSGDGDRGRILR